jgi:hypothetical protein
MGLAPQIIVEVQNNANHSELNKKTITERITDFTRSKIQSINYKCRRQM